MFLLREVAISFVFFIAVYELESIETSSKKVASPA